MSNDRDVAANLSKQAAVLVSSHRGQQHGDALASFTMIAELWSVWINHSVKVATGIPPTPPIHLTAYDALQMMAMLKKTRGVYGNRAEPDHYVDDIGYTSLAGMANLMEGVKHVDTEEEFPHIEVFSKDGRGFNISLINGETPDQLVARLNIEQPDQAPYRLTPEPIPAFLRERKKAAQ